MKEKEKEVQESVVKLRQYQMQAEAMTQQIAMLQSSMDEHEKAIATVRNIKGMSPDDGIIVPIGASSYIYATLRDNDKIIIGLGSGVSAEKSPEDAIKSLERRRDEMSSTSMEMGRKLAEIQDTIQKLQSDVNRIIQAIRKE
jgi:prefoldin alpha subunit